MIGPFWGLHVVEFLVYENVVEFNLEKSFINILHQYCIVLIINSACPQYRYLSVYVFYDMDYDDSVIPLIDEWDSYQYKHKGVS